jgi:hypothetical protein
MNNQYGTDLMGKIATEDVFIKKYSDLEEDRFNFYINEIEPYTECCELNQPVES